jgi:hypothetical protein
MYLRIVRTSIALLFFSCLISPGEDESANQMAVLKATYQKELQKASEEEIATITGLQNTYLEKLKIVEKKFQTEGKLEPLLAVRKEIGRFQSEREITPASLSRDIAEIAPAQAEYVNSLKKIGHDSARKILSLASYYDKSLESLQVKLTKMNNVDAALEVKKERDGIEAQAEIKRAKSHDSTSAIDPGATPKSSPQKDPEPVKPAEKKPPNHQLQKLVGARIAEFFKPILMQKWSMAADFVNPEFIRTNGRQNGEAILNMKYSLSRYGAARDGRFEWSEIELSDDEKKASASLKLHTKGREIDLGKLNWILINSSWYLDPAPKPAN